MGQLILLPESGANTPKRACKSSRRAPSTQEDRVGGSCYCHQDCKKKRRFSFCRSILLCSGGAPTQPLTHSSTTGMANPRAAWRSWETDLPGQPQETACRQRWGSGQPPHPRSPYHYRRHTHLGVGVWEAELIQTVLPRVQKAAHGQGPVSTADRAGTGRLSMSES